jgi:hypothetical protein
VKIYDASRVVIELLNVVEHRFSNGDVAQILKRKTRFVLADPVDIEIPIPRSEKR